MHKHSYPPPPTPPPWLLRLQAPTSITTLPALAARFLYSLRLIALYRSAGRDPAAELAVRLESMSAALHALELSGAIQHCWPEPVVVSRFCCDMLSHDELTIGRMIEAAACHDRAECTRQLDGLLRPERIAILWDAAVQLVGAELAGR